MFPYMHKYTIQCLYIYLHEWKVVCHQAITVLLLFHLCIIPIWFHIVLWVLFENLLRICWMTLATHFLVTHWRPPCLSALTGLRSEVLKTKAGTLGGNSTAYRHPPTPSLVGYREHTKAVAFLQEKYNRPGRQDPAYAHSSRHLLTTSPQWSQHPRSTYA